MTITNDFFNRLEGVWQNSLDGEWQDSFGWNFISQPKLGEPGTDDFEMRIDQMRETIRFKKLGGIARNVGITGEAGFWQAMAYECSIETPNGDGIHHEMGHFLLKVLESGETGQNLRGDVIRQATIPRANSMMTTGVLQPGTVSDAIYEQAAPFYDAKPRANDDRHQKLIDNELASKQKQVSDLSGPDLQRPLVWLQTILADEPVDSDWVFGFRHDHGQSQMASGQRVCDPVSIGNLLSDFWIAKRILNGETIETLQYAQKVNLIFHNMEWPHVSMNTLIKQS